MQIFFSNKLFSNYFLSCYYNMDMIHYNIILLSPFYTKIFLIYFNDPIEIFFTYLQEPDDFVFGDIRNICNVIGTDDVNIAILVKSLNELGSMRKLEESKFLF